MSSIQMTSDGDIDLSKKDLTIIKGPKSIAQINIQRLKTHLGEWFLDEGLGIPYFELIFQKGTTEVEIRSILRSELSSIPNQSLTSFNFSVDRENRSFALEFEVESNGETFKFSEDLKMDSFI